VIGSTHRGEEEIFVEVLLSLRRKFPNILLIVAPRHPERFAEVEALLRRMDVRYRKRSEDGPMDLSGYEALLVDSVGELAWLYEWATVVFLGGTLANVGGHNLIEPGRCAKPILIGPSRANVAVMAEAMLDAGAAIEVRTKDDVLGRLEYLFEHREIAAAMGRRGRAIAAEDHGVVSKTMRLLNDVLERSSADR
jgi:3-deoxy-D-manno-octulosonic-acid transferase